MARSGRQPLLDGTFPAGKVNYLGKERQVGGYKAIFPVNKVMSRYMRDSMHQIQLNFIKQQMFPKEVYSGYRKVNEERRKRGSWFSTGKGARSLKARLVRADENEVTMVFQYLGYLDFVDLGVGAGVKESMTDRVANASIFRRYIGRWSRYTGQSHRPMLYKELGPYGHLVERIKDTLADHYAWAAEMRVTETFDTDNPIFLNLY